MLRDASATVGSSAACAWYRTVCQAPSARHVAHGCGVARAKLRYVHVYGVGPLERAIA